ncbi:MAG: DNA alkylation repair protein [Calditrichaeota bacterium]|nr:DNA alkylation repair protein [Calditrichota bacterium]
MNWTIKTALNGLRELADPEVKNGLSRFGIPADQAIGVKIPQIKQLAKTIGKNHSLAVTLWEQPVHEAKLLAIYLADPQKTDPELMDKWVADFYSWDICDQACGELFDKTTHVWAQIAKWSTDKREFVKRAAFSLIAESAVHLKTADDQHFIECLPVIKNAANDDRKLVKKAVNWALRQIGKRNKTLHQHALECAEEIARTESKNARWIANNAIQELNSEKIRIALNRR